MINLATIKYYIRLVLGKHPYLRRDAKWPYERFGTEYGGWNILKNSVNSQSIVFSVGIGEDISFDLGLIKKYGCRIYAYDPTPKVAFWLADQHLPPSFLFHPVGLASANGQVEFFTPDNPEHISHSARPSASHKGKMLYFQVRKLSSLMQEHGLGHIDLLKMDIEGFEYDVLKNILEENLDIRQVLVEFHHGLYSFTNQDTIKAVQALRRAGYKLFSISNSGREYSFYR